MSREIDIYERKLTDDEVYYLETRGRTDLLRASEQIHDVTYKPQFEVIQPTPVGMDSPLAGGSVIPTEQAFGTPNPGVLDNEEDDEEELDDDYAKWTKKQLFREIKRRNSERPEEEQIEEPPASAKKSVLVAALEDDDEAQEDDDEVD